MRLKELSEYKNKIISTIISNDNLIKALTNNVEDFLNQPLISDVTSTIYTNIFPYKFIPTKNNDSTCYLTMTFSNFKTQGNQFKVGSIYFYVFCHKSLLRTSYGCLRYDYIANQIDELFNSNEYIGVGEMKFDGMSDMQVDDDYIGCWICYNIMSFN